MIDNYECEVINHLGDITKLDGAKIPKVDVICGGSPCQDLSVAGKREGLSGERSGLFMEQIRIIKEMRESDRASGRTNVDIRPRYMVWENVPGAFSSNKGEDFRIVLEETAKVVERDACIPGPPNKGKWTPSGCIMGNGWSIAWRVHDAQFWGVPQRRKRISLVADFGGATAPEILFERKGLSGDTEESGKEGEGITTDAERSIGETSCYEWHSQDLRVNEIKDNVSPTLSSAMGMGGASMTTPMLIKQETGESLSFQERAGKEGGGKGILIQNERIGALSTLNNQSVRYGISSYESNAMKSANPHSGVYEAETARTLDLNGGNPACNQGGMAVVYNGAGITSPINASNPKPGDPCHTLTDDSRNYLVQGADMYNGSLTGDIAATLNATSGDSPTHSGPSVVCLENHPNDSRVKIREDGKVQTLSSRMGTGGGNVPMVMESSAWDGSQVAQGPGAVCQSIVRRLTPLECERLQGFPDGWTDIGDWIDSKGKKHKGEADSPRYKALGNSIALPFWQYLADKMCAYLKEPTMGSLFDGIGGFPLVFSRAGATPVWASEIEEFPIAVTKLRFSKETN